jgi:hypothetical protein
VDPSFAWSDESWYHNRGLTVKAAVSTEERSTSSLIDPGAVMAASLRDIQVLRNVLAGLNAERPAVRLSLFDEETRRTAYQDRSGDFRRRLLLAVESRVGKARVLVTGQIGVGKSSELREFYEERLSKPELGFPIFCDLEKAEGLEQLGSAGVFLTVFRDCWATTRESAFHEGGRADLDRLRDEIRDEILTRLIDWLHGVYADDRSQVVFTFGGREHRISLADRSKALLIVLRKAALHGPVAESSERFTLDFLDMDALIAQLNRLLEWFALRGGGRPPLLIIDHVDKIREREAAEDVLVRSFSQWDRLKASVVMTAPFEYTLGTPRTSIESRWGRPLVLYPLDIPDPLEGPIPQVYRAIAAGAGLAELITDEALRLLAHYSGGILRIFVQFLDEAAQEAHFADQDRIGRGEAQSVIFRARQAYLDYGEKELQLLDEIDRLGAGLGKAAILLRSPIGLLVIEPRPGEPGLRVHPLARTTLGQYRFQKLGATA